MRLPIPVSTRLAASLLVVGALAACAPQNTNTSYSAGAVGVPSSVSYGTIVGTRPVSVQDSRGAGVGTVAGAGAGALAGSFIGGGWRENAIGAVGGALIGGLAGNAIGRGVSTSQMVEFTIRPDGGAPDMAVVQSNELQLQAGDRVVMSYDGRAMRLARAAGGPPPVAYQPPPQGYPQTGYPQAGYPEKEGYPQQQGYSPYR